jgi:hypothetical protein
MRVNWEWQVCHVDKHGDIQDLDFADSLSELAADWQVPVDGCVQVTIRLVRSEYTESEGLLDKHEFWPDDSQRLVCDEAPNMACRQKSQREFDAFRRRN